jgi:hypothetical protein
MRPEYEPTADQRALVENAAAFGLTQTDIAEQLGIAEKTLRKYFRDDLSGGVFMANMKVAFTSRMGETRGRGLSRIQGGSTDCRAYFGRALVEPAPRARILPTARLLVDETRWTEKQRQKRAVAEYLAALEVAAEGDSPNDNESGGPESKRQRRYEWTDAKDEGPATAIIDELITRNAGTPPNRPRRSFRLNRRARSQASDRSRDSQNSLWIAPP